MNVRTHRSQFCCRLLAGWLGLLVYVGAFSPIGMTAVALLGALDPDHRVQFQAGAEGGQVVLHHEDRLAGHHHGTVARLLTLFAQSPSDTNADHVLKFSAEAGVKSDSQTQLAAANPAGCKAVFFAEPATPFAIRPFQVTASPRSPPDAGGLLPALRSTVLLI